MLLVYEVEHDRCNMRVFVLTHLLLAFTSEQLLQEWSAVSCLLCKHGRFLLERLKLTKVDIVLKELFECLLVQDTDKVLRDLGSILVGFGVISRSGLVVLIAIVLS